MLLQIPLGPYRLEHPEALIALFLGFALLLFLLYRMGLPPLQRALAERSTHIQESYAQADRQLAEAQQVRDDYAQRIAQIEVEHRARLDAAVRDADAARADIIADAQETARALRWRGEEEIARERTRQRILLRRQLVQITLDAAEQSIHELNSDVAQRSLISDFIARVGAPGNGHQRAQGLTGNGSAAAPVASVMESETPARKRRTPTQEGA